MTTNTLEIEHEKFCLPRPGAKEPRPSPEGMLAHYRVIAVSGVQARTSFLDRWFWALRGRWSIIDCWSLPGP